MALYSEITYDSRVIREAQTLGSAGHDVTVYCLGGEAPAGASFRVVTHTPSQASVLPDGSSPFLRMAERSIAAKTLDRARWIMGYAKTIRAWGRWATKAGASADAWHAHDLTGLMAVGPFVRSPTTIVYDSHEIFLESGTAARMPGPARRALRLYERRLARRALALVTVNEGYAEVLGRRLRPRRLTVVRNCPPRWTPSPGVAARLRDVAGVPDPHRIVLYHGAFSAGRGIRQLIDAMLVPDLAAAHLVLLGLGPERPAIDRLAADPRYGGRVHVVDAVPPEELLDLVAGADVNVIPLQGSTLNHRLCTPNKLWESLATGVPVVVSDFPIMRRIVLGDPAGPLGRVCDPASPDSIGSAVVAILGLLPDDAVALRTRCFEAAQRRWNWETESARLLDLYDLIGGGERIARTA
jgi:glycosyltransferase involved in cell wall biosynthesis